MLNYIPFWPQPLLGLDIQVDQIRLLQLQRSRKIKRALTIDLPAGAVVDNKIQEAEIVSDRLQELVRNSKLQTRETAIALPEDCVVTKYITVEKELHESDLEAEIISQISHHFSGAAESLCYDYAMLDECDETQSNVFLAATSFAYLNTYMTVVQNAGLKVRVIDVDNYAWARASQFVENNGLQIEEKWLISFGLALRSNDL